MTVEQLKAALAQAEMENQTRVQIETLRTQSKERIFAGETAFEAQLAREARAHGMQPAGSGGYVSAGEKPLDSNQ